MQKGKVYSFLGSNIENLGTELERNCKKTSAECEAEWKKTGKSVGLLIWRIEKFKVVPWPEKLYGQFYDGDSYIVLNTYGVAPKLLYDIHFWLGQDTTQDEAGTAAYKTVELDTYLDDVPVQHREVQGYESKRFVSYFANGIRILHGGVESGFHHVKPEDYRPRLLHLRGNRGDIRVSEVPLVVSSLNSGDVFILDSGLTLYQWNGSKASGMEKIKAAQLCRAIDDERAGKPQVVVLEEGNDDPKFWGLLGGKAAVKSAADADHEFEHAVAQPKKLYQLSDATGKLEFKEVATGRVTKNLLNSSDVFVFDAGSEVFVWIGKGASAQEKSKGLSYADHYLKQHNRPLFLSISRILEGGENEHFLASFD